MTPVLFCRANSAYKARPECDAYDAERNALTFGGGAPAIYHPPCRSWSALSHMAFRGYEDRAARLEAERELALWSVEMVREHGGILEHPAKSKLWKRPDLAFPTRGLAGEPLEVDLWGGVLLEVNQYHFGHVASKPTCLYIVGCPELPPVPFRVGKPEASMTGQVPNTRRATQYEREYTPEALIDWLLETVERIKENQR